MRTSRLSLSDVTLVAVDTFNPDRTLNAMRFSMRHATFADAILVCPPGFQPTGGWQGIKPHYAAITSSRLRREQFIITKLHEVFATAFCLHMEWDSSVGNPSAWDDSWKQWDYIGAPWPYPGPMELVPVGPHNCVGNLGFALISKSFLQTVAKYGVPTDNQALISDAYMCRVMRPALEAQGIKFAPEAVAERFSCEDRLYSGQFGWHGKHTAAKNGWNIEVIMK